MLSYAGVLLVGTMLVGQADKSSNYQHLKDYGDLLAGRWIGDITLIADWPGISKKAGEKGVAYTTVRWILDGNGLEQEHFLGESVFKAIHFWDASSKKIKAIYLDSSGRVGESFVEKKDRVWTWTHEATLGDGKKVTGSGTIGVEDNGDTIIYQGTVYVGGEKTLPYRDVFKRVSNTAGN